MSVESELSSPEPSPPSAETASQDPAPNALQHGPKERDPEEVRRATLAAVALEPGAKARVTGYALSLCGASSLAFGGLAFYFAQSERGAQALGVFLGHAAAQLLTATWLAGAILTFDRSTSDFMKATLGASPLRFVVLATVVGLGLWLSEPDQPALFFSLMATHVFGHFVEHSVLERLQGERLSATKPRTET